jgi:hypothetical protein
MIRYGEERMGLAHNKQIVARFVSGEHIFTVQSLVYLERSVKKKVSGFDFAWRR